MNKSEIAARVAGRTGLARPAAAEVVDTVFEVIAEALAGGEEVRVVGFGVFGVKTHPDRTWRNPGNRRMDADQGVQGADIQGRKAAQRRREGARRVVGRWTGVDT